MQKLVLGCFVALCGMLVVNACTCGPGPEGDGGVEDAGGEGEGEGEGEEPLVVGDTCNPAASLCADGLVCVPNQAGTGTCRVDCADDAAACSGSTTCQDIIAPDNTVVTACVGQTSARDGACLAWLDPDACTDDMSCLLTTNEEDELGNVTLGFNCKVTCDPNAENADDQCPGDEACALPSTAFFQNFQPNAAGDDILECTLANCEEGGTGCECDAEAGFDCYQTTTSEAGMGICAFIPGQCAELVQPLDVPLAELTEDYICDEAADHRFCDDSMVLEGGAAACVTGFFNDSDTAGLCFALCSTPTADYDGDGTITTTGPEEGLETGEFVGCAEGWECSLDIARDTLLGPGAPDANAQFGIRECDVSACTAGEPCPGECGEGDYECIEVNATLALCIAPYGSCVPEGAPTDGGPDAGEPDAGVDAGGEEPDAGEPDAGDDGVDGGDSVADSGDADAN